MKVTAGEFMFYGGIGLFVAAVIAFVIIKIILSSKGKKIKTELAHKYDI